MTAVEKTTKEIEKTKAKIASEQQKLRELEARKIEEENQEIIKMVRDRKLLPNQLAAVLEAKEAEKRSLENIELSERTEILTHEKEN